MSYLYETHLHTKPSSKCGVLTGTEQARIYHELGYTGVIVTDHFFGGNSGVDRSLPWKERVEFLCAGYEEAKREGDRIGLEVLFGWEQSFPGEFPGEDYLVYGPDKEWLLAHPESEKWSKQEQLIAIHEAGGCVVRAHPFRHTMEERSYSFDCEDAIEIANRGNKPESDGKAYAFAKEHRLPITSGSDNHGRAPWGLDDLCGICLDKKLESINDYVKMILSRESFELIIPPARRESERMEHPLRSDIWLSDNR